MKKIKILFLILFLILSTKEIYGAEHKIDSFTVDATVLDNGDLQVEEIITGEFNINEAFTRAIPKKLFDKYQDVEMEKNISAFYKQYEVRSITNLTVGELDKKGTFYPYSQETNIESNGEQNVYSIIQTIDNNVDRINITTSSDNKAKKTYKISYTINNVAIKYGDTAEIYWNFLGEGFNAKINDVKIKIHFPHNIEAKNLNYYPHGISPDRYTIENNNTVYLKFKNLKENETITNRILFPNDQILTSTNIGFFNIIDDVNEIEQNISVSVASDEIDIDAIAIIQIIMIVGIVIYFIFLYLLYEKDILFPIESVDELKILEEYNPLIAACILKDRNLQPRDIVATLLNLVNKKILKMERKIKNDGSCIYEISRNGEGNIKKIDDIELYIYDWFFIEDEKIELVSTLKAFSKSDDTMFKAYRLQQIVDRQLEKLGANRRKVPKKIKRINNIIFGIVSIFIFYSMIDMTVINPIKLFNISIGTISNNLIILLLSLLLPLLLLLALYIIQVLSYRKAGINRIIKIEINNFLKFMIPYSVVALLATLIDILLFSGIHFTFNIVLIIGLSAIILSDKLLSSNDKNLVKLASKINMIKNKIEGRLLKDKAYEKKDMSDRDITYGITLGVSESILKKVPAIAETKLFELDIMKKSIKNVMKKYNSKINQ